MSVNYLCDIFICSPTDVTDLAMDGLTQLPLRVIYAIYFEDNGNYVNIPDQDRATLTLVDYMNGVDLNLNGWTYSDSPGSDVITGDGGGCDQIGKTPGVTYQCANLYLLHSYKEASQQATFTVAATLDASKTSAAGVWTTAKDSVPPAQAVNNQENQTVGLTLCDGTPSVELFFQIVSANNTIVANGNNQLPVELDFSISSGTGGTGKPLSKQTTATCKLVTYYTGENFDGYTGGHDDSYGKWVTALSGSDSSDSFTMGSSVCSGAGTGPLTGDYVANIFYISHTPTFIDKQSVPVSAWISYTPPGATKSIVWNTDQRSHSPQAACLNLTALGQG